MELLALFETIEQSAVGQAIKLSPWAFAVIESVHLLGLAALGGSILLVDLRMLGIGLGLQPVARLARDVQPILLISLAVMLVTGAGLFVSESVKCYYSEPFRLKMMFLAAAALFTFTVRRQVARAGEDEVTRARRAIVALASIGLWFGVAASGRWIGFSG
jgi:hypothetical protein